MYPQALILIYTTISSLPFDLALVINNMWECVLRPEIYVSTIIPWKYATPYIYLLYTVHSIIGIAIIYIHVCMFYIFFHAVL